MPESTPLSSARGSVLPEGIHVFKVIDFEEKMGGSGYPYWAFTAEVQGGDWEGQTCWINISHSPGARFRVDQWLDAFKVPEDAGEVYGEEFIGKTFRGKVEHREFNGQIRPNVTDVLPTGSGKAQIAGKAKPVPRKPGKPKEPVVADPDPIDVVDSTGDLPLEGSEVTTDKGLPEDAAPTGPRRKAF